MTIERFNSFIINTPGAEEAFTAIVNPPLTKEQGELADRVIRKLDALETMAGVAAVLSSSRYTPMELFQNLYSHKEHLSPQVFDKVVQAVTAVAQQKIIMQNQESASRDRERAARDRERAARTDAIVRQLTLEMAETKRNIAAIKIAGVIGGGTLFGLATGGVGAAAVGACGGMVAVESLGIGLGIGGAVGTGVGGLGLGVEEAVNRKQTSAKSWIQIIQESKETIKSLSDQN